MEPPTRSAHPWAAAVWMTAAQALFGVMSLCGRLGSSSTPWQEVLLVRFLVGAITAYAVARASGRSLSVRSPGWQALRTTFGTLAAIGTFYLLGQRAISLGDSVTLFSTSPILVALLGWPLLGERVRVREALAVALAFGGIVVVARPSLSGAPLLVVCGLLTALSSALAMIWLRKMGPGESSEAIVFQFSAGGSVVALLLAIPVWKTPGPVDALLLLGTGLAGGLAQIAMTKAYALDSAARVSAIGYSGIVFTRLYAFPVFHEVPSAAQVLGSLLVIASGVALSFASARAAARARVPVARS